MYFLLIFQIEFIFLRWVPWSRIIYLRLGLELRISWNLALKENRRILMLYSLFFIVCISDWLFQNKREFSTMKLVKHLNVVDPFEANFKIKNHFSILYVFLSIQSYLHLGLGLGIGWVFLFLFPFPSNKIEKLRWWVVFLLIVWISYWIFRLRGRSPIWHWLNTQMWFISLR